MWANKYLFKNTSEGVACGEYRNDYSIRVTIWVSVLMLELKAHTGRGVNLPRM